MPDSNTDTERLFEQIRQGDESVLREIYEGNRRAFMKWSSRQFNCTEDQASEAYQKAFTILYYNIKDQKITELSSSLSTYLFGIGKNVVRRLLGDKGNKFVSLENVAEERFSKIDYYDAIDDSHQRSKVKGMLELIGEPCKSVLVLFFFKQYTMESIAREMGYKNEVVAKKKKFLCLKKLKEMVKEKSM